MDGFFARTVGLSFALDSWFSRVYSGDVEQCGCWRFDYYLFFMAIIRKQNKWLKFIPHQLVLIA
jgi:hypothetical protein